MTIKELIEKRVKLNADAQALLDKAAAEKRELSAEEQQSFDRMHADIMAVKGTIDRQGVQEAETRELAESRGRKTETTTEPNLVRPTLAQDRDLAFRGWCLGRRSTVAMQEAARRAGVDLANSEIEARALALGATDTGGYSVPDELMRAYYEFQKSFGSVRSVAQKITTATGAALPVPTINDTSNVGEIIAEAGAVTTTVDPTFGQVVFDAYKYSSKAVIVSVELLQDSSVNLASFLGAALGTRIARIQNTHFTTGDASSKPNGIVTASAVGKTAVATNAFTFDEIIDLVHSVDPAYRSRAGLMMHDTIAAVTRKLKDGQSRYLWELSTQVGVPDRLLGYPVTINNDMASALTTGQKLMLFGDFGGYMIRDAGPVVFARADELRILNHQVVFLAFQRSDGDLIDTTSVKHLKLA
jgi:HK97 family phage major capsid protein